MTNSITPKPRLPGLDLAKRPGQTDDDKNFQLVQDAEVHLRKLLEDPYYYEAHLRMRRRGELDLDKGGNLPWRKGALAESYQNQSDGQVLPAARGAGRKPDPKLNFPRQILDAYEKSGERSSLKRVAGIISRVMNRNLNRLNQEAASQDLYEKLKRLRRTRRESKKEGA